MCGQKAETSSNYCDDIQPYNKRCFSLLSNVRRFLDCCFWKLPQIRTSNFRKVVLQHTEGMVESISFFGNLLLFPAVSDFENPSKMGGHIFLKADDIILLAPSVSALQHLLDVCESELQYLDMSINVNKSVCTRVGSRHAQPCRNLFTSDAREIVWRESIRYT